MCSVRVCVCVCGGGVVVGVGREEGLKSMTPDLQGLATVVVFLGSTCSPVRLEILLSGYYDSLSLRLYRLHCLTGYIGFTVSPVI